jgi:TonB family protein
MNTKASPVEWVGRLVDQRFPLIEYLGSAESGDFFRTDLPGAQTQKAAIRLVPAEIEGAQAQFDDWAQAEGLSHPNLLRIFESGRGRIDENEFLYVVMELPDEALDQVLATRKLTGPEAGEMLPPILDALAYLHAHGLVHGHMTPSNILVVDDRVKLSADALQQSGHLRKLQGGLRIYDAPEIAQGVISPESDMWSLGITLVEALTQLPPLRNSSSGDPGVPQFMPEPFAEIARQCLRVNPAARATLAEISEALRVPARRTAPVPPTAPVPQSRPAPPAPPPAPAAAPRPNPPQAAPAPAAAPEQGALAFDEIRPSSRAMRSVEDFDEAPPSRLRTRPSTPFLVGLAALLVVLIAALFVRSHKSAPTSAPETQASAPATAAQPAAANPAPPAASHHKVKTAASPAPPTAPKPAPGTPAPPAAAAPAAPPPTSAGAPTAKGEVAEQVMPDDRVHADRTIHGRVTVRVRLSVDREGNVSDASLDSAGPSRYFAKIAVEAARKWRFKPTQANGSPVPSTWLLRFEFRRGGTTVNPVEVTR